MFFKFLDMAGRCSPLQFAPEAYGANVVAALPQGVGPGRNPRDL
ncbi:hypothetical protein LCGC14_0016400 [marine sediment metagenome]|uniref:Uncharacterized protein n=1 Tax=marine sediment metagenome TaxID=412755 RepID=A0A0F9Z222_9ZZZZ